MSAESLLSFEPPELIFHVELHKQLSSSIQLSNGTENHVAFKLLANNRKKYGVRPRIGILKPRSACEIIVTMRAIREDLHSTRCKDRFMIQSAIANPDATVEDAQNMFNREAGHVFEECKLRVVYRKPESSPGPCGMNGSHNVLEVTSSVVGHDDNVAEVTSPVIRPDDNVAEVTSPVIRLDDNVAETSPGKLLDVQSSELKFPLGPRKDVSCMLQLSNVTEDHVAYRVKTQSQKFTVEPKVGHLSPQSTFNVTVKLQVESESPPEDLPFEDKFVIQSVLATSAIAMEDIQDMFERTSLPVEEHELKVIHFPEQEYNTSHAGELVLRCSIICIVVMVSCYVMKWTMSLIWSLVMLVMMLTIKMVQKLVSDSIEDWIVKTILSLIMYLSPVIASRLTSKCMGVANLKRAIERKLLSIAH